MLFKNGNNIYEPLNSKKNESNKFIYEFTDKLNFKSPKKNMALANLRIYYTWKNIKSEYSNKKFKISAPTWNDEFNLPDGSYFISDKALFTFVPNKQFDQLIAIKPHSPTMLKTTNAEFSSIEIWFTDQNNRQLKLEDNVNVMAFSHLQENLEINMVRN